MSISIDRLLLDRLQNWLTGKVIDLKMRRFVNSGKSQESKDLITRGEVEELIFFSEYRVLDAPDGETATQIPGFGILLTWNAFITDDLKLLKRFNVYRNTVNDSSTATQIGSTVFNAFLDISIAGLLTSTATYYYWIKAVSIFEEVTINGITYDGLSAFSGVVSAIPGDEITLEKVKITTQTQLDYATASKPLFTNASKRAITQNIDLDAAYFDNDLPINKGGTNATTAAGARTSLDLYSTGEVDTAIAAAFASGLSVTVPLAKLTGGGTDGSITFTNGLLTARVDPT